MRPSHDIYVAPRGLGFGSVQSISLRQERSISQISMSCRMPALILSAIPTAAWTAAIQFTEMKSELQRTCKALLGDASPFDTPLRRTEAKRPIVRFQMNDRHKPIRQMISRHVSPHAAHCCPNRLPVDDFYYAPWCKPCRNRIIGCSLHAYKTGRRWNARQQAWCPALRITTPRITAVKYQNGAAGSS
jgi:hypothetical protein